MYHLLPHDRKLMLRHCGLIGLLPLMTKVDTEIQF